MNVHHDTGVSAVLTLHQFFSVYIGIYQNIAYSKKSFLLDKNTNEVEK